MMLEKQKYVKEYLKVLQETLPKESLADILSGIAIGDDVSSLLEKAMLEARSPLEQEVHTAVHPFNPKEVDTIDLIKSLRENVVRLVFYKVDGSRRIMYATRNPDIIKLYDADSKNPNKSKKNDILDIDNEEKIARQIDTDAIRVFDLEKNEFRTFKPSRLAEFDKGDSVGSWIEFKPEYDSWYIMAKEGGDINKYYVGNRKAKNIGKSKERREYEAVAHQDLRDAEYTREQDAKMEAQLANDPEHQAKMKKSNFEFSYNLLKNKHLPKFSGQVFSADYEDTYLYGKFFVDMIATSNPEIVKVNKYMDADKIIIFTILDNIHIFHPHVLYDTSSKHVYFDYTKMMTSSKVVTQDVLSAQDLLKDFVAYVSTKRTTILKPLNPRYTEKDKKRAMRVAAIINQFPLKEKYGVEFKQEGMSTILKPTSGDADVTLTITPYVANITMISGRVRHYEMGRRPTPTGSLVTIEQAIEELGRLYKATRFESYAKLIKALEVLQTAYNLRTVKFDGERFQTN